MRIRKMNKIKKDLDFIKSNLNNLDYNDNILDLINKSDNLLENYKKIQKKINNEEKVLVSFKKFIKSLFIRRNEKKYVLYNNTNHAKFILQ